jgi:hypothetical protein
VVGVCSTNERYGRGGAIVPYFTTISPTCEPGGKPAAWERFRTGGYIAIGWCNDKDLTGMTVEEILRLIPGTSADERDARDGMHSFPVFWELCQRGALGRGDYVAVKNVNHGLFGVGIIKSGYKYSRKKHDTGVPDHHYPHYVDVEWVWTDYIPSTSLVFGDDARWWPYGTIGQLYTSLPSYIVPYTRTGV